jgi:hypothetical protein
LAAKNLLRVFIDNLRIAGSSESKVSLGNAAHIEKISKEGDL